MPGFGHFNSMISRDKSHRISRKNQKDNFSKILISNSKDTIDFKKLSSTELAILRKNNLQKIRKAEFFNLLKFIGISLILAISLFVYNKLKG